MEQSPTAKSTIVVSGDVVVDHHLYEGERDSPTTEHRRGVRDWCELGGAVLLKETLACLLETAKDDAWTVRLGIRTPALDENPCGHHAYAVWQPVVRTSGDARNRVW